jgi:hypothetical protein
MQRTEFAQALLAHPLARNEMVHKKAPLHVGPTECASRRAPPLAFHLRPVARGHLTLDRPPGRSWPCTAAREHLAFAEKWPTSQLASRLPPMGESNPSARVTRRTEIARKRIHAEKILSRIVSGPHSQGISLWPLKVRRVVDSDPGRV